MESRAGIKPNRTCCFNFKTIKQYYVIIYYLEWVNFVWESVLWPCYSLQQDSVVRSTRYTVNSNVGLHVPYMLLLDVAKMHLFTEVPFNGIAPRKY